jgi:phosphoribosylformylglycinamidine synthase
MKAAVLVFPGSNCDRDLAVAFEKAGADVSMVWHKDEALPEGTDIVGVPGGFSFGDYLRCGAIAARSPIIAALRRHAEAGGYVLGICNGFQVLTETGLLPGALMRNVNLRYICKAVELEVTGQNAFTSGYRPGQRITVPIAHHDGNYQIDPEGLARLQGDGRIAFRYLEGPNGSIDNIAGITSSNGRVLGMMPHPERAAEPAHGRTDGSAMFRALVEQLAQAPA